MEYLLLARCFVRAGPGVGCGVGWGLGTLGCVLTVESFFVDNGAAAQGLVVLLVTHECVHAQDGCRDKKRL